MALRSTLVWTFTTTQYSSSIALEHRDFVGIRSPAMEAGTTGFNIQTTEDLPSVADGAATWETVVDINGNAITFPAAAASATPVRFNPGNYLRMGRCRLVAVDGGGAGVNQNGQSVTPILREF